MAFTEKVYVGRDLSVTADGSRARWIDYDITDKWNTSDATAGDSADDEVAIITGLVEGKLTGYICDTNNPGTLPQKGDVLNDFAVAVGGDSVLPDMSRHGNIKVLEFNTNGSKDPLKWSLSFRSGVLNDPPA